MNTKLITIIIVNWNGKKWLKRCLGSLKRQTYKYLEVIVVDNDSTDDSVEYIKKTFPHVIVLQNRKNVGFATANNKGIAKSKGKYIVLLNNDTWVKPDFTQKLYDYYMSHQYAVIAPVEHRYSHDAYFPCNTTLDILGSPAYYQPTYKKGKTFFLGGVCLFFEKQLYLETHGLDNNFFMYFEDADWFWRLNMFGKTFAFVRSIPLFHAGAGTTGKGIQYKAFLWRNQNLLQMLLKNYSSLMLVLVIPLYILQNIVEILFFIFAGKFKIAMSYVEGWYFNIKNWDHITRERKWIQRIRSIDDWHIMRKMYMGSGKLLLLKTYLSHTS